MKVKGIKNQNNGFSLIEVLLAIVILGLIAAPILQIFLTSASVNNRSKEIMAATELASTTMEYINGCKFEGVKDAFTDEDETCKLPAVNFNVDATGGIHVLGHYDMEQIDVNSTTTTPASQMGMLAKLEKYSQEQIGAGNTVNGNELYYGNNGDNYGFAFQNIKYNGYTYDMAIWFTDKGQSSDVYYTYDVEIVVYLVEDLKKITSDGDIVMVPQHFETKIATMTGAVANE